MSRLHRLALAGLLAAVPLSSCASRRGESPGAAAVRPPVLLPGARPQLRYPERPQSGRVLDIQIEVAVDLTGQPEFATLRVTGLGATENRDVVAAWLEQARFQPATQAGQPVRGVYRTRILVRAEVRRVG